MKDKKLVIETFRDFNSPYFINQLKDEEPSFVNNLRIKKYRVTIEEIEEPKEVYIERLEALLKDCRGYTKSSAIKNYIKSLKEE